MKTDCRPNRFKKYHESDDTHLTSKSLVAIPDCSMDLKRIVSGKGSFIITNPAKNAFIQLMIKVCGIIIIMFPFIIPIIPSIAAGSVIGFPAGLPWLSTSLRKTPPLKLWTIYSRRGINALCSSWAKLVRRLTPRRSDRCSRSAGAARGLGVVANRVVA